MRLMFEKEEDVQEMKPKSKNQLWLLSVFCKACVFCKAFVGVLFSPDKSMDEMQV